VVVNNRQNWWQDWSYSVAFNPATKTQMHQSRLAVVPQRKTWHDVAERSCGGNTSYHRGQMKRQYLSDWCIKSRNERKEGKEEWCCH
jgi:hypothetical protein